MHAVYIKLGNEQIILCGVKFSRFLLKRIYV